MKTFMNTSRTRFEHCTKAQKKLIQKAWRNLLDDGCEVVLQTQHLHASNPRWRDVGEDGELHRLGCYRVVPHPRNTTTSGRKTTVDWDHLHESIQFIARDACGSVFAYGSKPNPDPLGTQWVASDPVILQIAGAETVTLASLVRGGIDWEEDITERPS